MSTPIILAGAESFAATLAIVANPLFWVGIPAAIYGAYWLTTSLLHAQNIEREVTQITLDEAGNEIKSKTLSEDLSSRLPKNVMQEAITSGVGEPFVAEPSRDTVANSLCWFTNQSEEGGPKQSLGISLTEKRGSSNPVSYTYTPQEQAFLGTNGFLQLTRNTEQTVDPNRSFQVTTGSGQSVITRDCLHWDTNMKHHSPFDPSYLQTYYQLGQSTGTNSLVHEGEFTPSPVTLALNSSAGGVNVASNVAYGVGTIALVFAVGGMARSAWNYFTKPAVTAAGTEQQQEPASKPKVETDTPDTVVASSEAHTDNVSVASVKVDATADSKADVQQKDKAEAAASGAAEKVVASVEGDALLTSSFVVDCLVYMSSALLALSVLLVAVGVLGLMGISVFMPPVLAICAGAVGIGVASTGLSFFASQNNTVNDEIPAAATLADKVVEADVLSMA